MSGSGRTVYIAGAGIAGLTLALALAKFGGRVVVLERNETIQEVGAGLQLSPNARRVLNNLGLGRKLSDRSLEPAGIDLVPFRSTWPLTTLTLGATIRERYGLPYAVMHRADLAEILFAACRRFANIEIAFGIRAFDAASDAGGVSVNTTEADGRSRATRAFAFVGADGVNSHTRTLLLAGPAATYSGYIAWRAAVPMESLNGSIALDSTTLLFAPGHHAVLYPLPHRRQVNIALFAPDRSASVFGHEPPLAPALPRAMLASPHFRAIVEAVGDDWTCWPVSTVTTGTWHRGAIGLIGDAAHAMLPFQAQGAAMAIEDASILAPLLMTASDAASAFSRYAALRQPRIEKVRKISSSNGFAFHLAWPLTLGRDAVLKLQGPHGHLRRLDWLYGYGADTEQPPRNRRRTDPERRAQ